MLFDVKAALAEILHSQALAATPATPATKRGNAAALSQLSRVSQGYPDENMPSAFRDDGKAGTIQLGAGHPKNTLRPSDPAGPDCYPYGRGPNGNPRTWTGRIVSAVEWQGLSEWDRHGSTGKVWNGLTGLWEPENTGEKSAFPFASFQTLGPFVAPDLQER
jgi:hypothetical protein